MKEPKVTLRDIENMPVNQVKRQPRATEIINPEKFFEIQSFGVTVNVTNNEEGARSCYHGVNSSNKVLYQTKGGDKWALEQKLG